MSDFQFQDFEDYLEQLCREHVDVQHELNGQVCFSRLRSQAEIDAIINNAGRNILLLGRFSGRAVGDSQEAGMRQFAVLRFASYADISQSGVDAAIDKAWNIMMDFIARFRKDYKDDDCGPLANVEFENLSWDEIDEPVYLENHYGWDLSLPFRSTQLEYDSDKWQ